MVALQDYLRAVRAQNICLIRGRPCQSGAQANAADQRIVDTDGFGEHGLRRTDPAIVPRYRSRRD